MTAGAANEAGGAPAPMRPIADGPASVNHRLPSGPGAIASGVPPTPSENSVISPLGLIRPIAPPSSANHTFPSGPVAIPSGKFWLTTSPVVNSVICPVGVIRPIAGLVKSVNHKLPSGPGASWNASPPRPAENSLTCPPAVTRPIALGEPVSVNQMFRSGPSVTKATWAPELRPLVLSVICPAGVIRPSPASAAPNHRFPSAPAAMPLTFGALTGNSVIWPAGVIRPIALVVPVSVNHRLPSGPAVSPRGKAPGFKPPENSVIWPLGVIRPIAGSLASVNQIFPSGPAAMNVGCEPAPSPLVNSVTCPTGAALAAPHRPITNTAH